MTFSRLPLVVTLAVMASPSLAYAASERLAFSDKLGVEVFALPDARGAWCRKDMTLELHLKDNSPLLTDGVEGFIPRLSPVFDDKCPQAASATVKPVKGAAKALFGKTLAARKADGWKATPVQESVAKADTKPALPQPAPEAAPKAQVAADPAPTPTPAPAPVTAPAPAQKASAKPLRDVAVDASYNNFLLIYAAEHGDALDDKAFMDNAARALRCQEFHKVADNEFKYGSFIKVTATQLAEAGNKAQGKYYRSIYRTEFKLYDAAKKSFEYKPLGENIKFDVNLPHPCYQRARAATVPNNFLLSWDGTAAINGLPMPQDQAEALVNKRSSKGYNQRLVYLEIVYSLVDVRKVTNQTAPIVAQLDEATVYADENLSQPLHVYSRGELVAIAKTLAEDQKAEAEKRQQQQDAEQKERQAIQDRYNASRDYSFLQSASAAQRVAYLHNGSRILSRTGPTIAQALISGKPIQATFMVRADGSGAKDIETKWPGRLVLNLDPGLSELKSGNWYVVSGDLRADGKDRQATGRLDVKAMTVCEREHCAESEDIAAMIAKRFPDANVAATVTPTAAN